MKNDESIHLIENILKQTMFLYIVLNCHAKTRTFWTRDSEAMFLGLKNTAQFFEDLFEKAKPGKIYFNTDLFQCTFVIMLMPDKKSVFY